MAEAEIQMPHYIDTDENVGSRTMSVCCCCLELVCRKCLWTEYTWMGQVEVYGNMIKDCYGIDIPGESRGICEVCITQLRNAVRFKRQLILSQDKLNALKNNIAKGNEFDLIDGGSKGNAHYGNEFDGDDCVIGCKQESVNYSDSDSSDDAPLVQALDRERGQKETLPKLRSGRRQYNYMKTRRNVCLILENSTILPFKSNKGYFTCFYCHKQHAVFEELKVHMSEHKDLTVKDSLKCLLRPHAIKVDASNLSCKRCGQAQQTMHDLIQHLTENHEIDFDFDAKLKPIDTVLPYDLADGKFRCFICKKDFMFFKTLSKHMNEHGANYVCDKCGKCFILPERLRAHKQNIHIDVSAVKCEHCGKLCSSNVVLKSHIRYTHKRILFVCSICDKKFMSFKKRFDHLQQYHGRAALNLTCDKCSKSFSTPGSLNNHVRKEHSTTTRDPKRFHCELCSMTFKTKSALKCHSVVHSGEKNFECEVCHKKYGRSRTLVEHMKIHRNDRRWSCAACAQAFVQKCSLKNHIRVHHGELNGDQLLIYKEPEKT